MLLWKSRTVIHMASLLPNRTVHCLLHPEVSLVLYTDSGWDLHHWHLAVLYRRAITQSIKGKNTPPEKNSRHPPSGEAATGFSIMYLTENPGNSIAVMSSTASYKGAMTEGSPQGWKPSRLSCLCCSWSFRYIFKMGWISLQRWWNREHQGKQL